MLSYYHSYALSNEKNSKSSLPPPLQWLSPMSIRIFNLNFGCHTFWFYTFFILFYSIPFENIYFGIRVKAARLLSLLLRLFFYISYFGTFFCFYILYFIFYISIYFILQYISRVRVKAVRLSSSASRLSPSLLQWLTARPTDTTDPPFRPVGKHSTEETRTGGKDIEKGRKRIEEKRGGGDMWKVGVALLHRYFNTFPFYCCHIVQPCSHPSQYLSIFPSKGKWNWWQSLLPRFCRNFHISHEIKISGSALSDIKITGSPSFSAFAKTGSVWLLLARCLIPGNMLAGKVGSSWNYLKLK